MMSAGAQPSFRVEILNGLAAVFRPPVDSMTVSQHESISLYSYTNIAVGGTMKAILLKIPFVVLLLVFLTPHFTFAETKTFIKEYTYQASEADSKLSSRTISLREVKRLILEELGTYLESETEVKNFQLTKDQITTLTAGIVQTELVEEKWDGRTYWLKAKIKADSNDVVKAIDTLRKDREKTKELEEIREKSEALLKENERLRQELATAKGEEKKKEAEAYNKNIKELDAAEWFEKGVAAYTVGNYAEALAAFSKVLELIPQYKKAYLARGVAYDKLGNYNQAIKDFDKAIELNPEDADVYVGRGLLYGKHGNMNQAIKDFNKAIELKPQLAEAYDNRGIAYRKLGKDNQAIKDYDKAIELNPKDSSVYYNRGLSYFKLGNNKQAIKDFSKVIEMSPQDKEAYYFRGYSYGKLGNDNQAFADIKTAARLGHKEAQDTFRENNIAW